MIYKINNLFWHLIDLIFPPSCAGCGVVGVRWCKRCQQETKKYTAPICRICGQRTKLSSVCKRCENTPPFFKAVRVWAEFDGPIRNAIHDLKYRKNIGLGVSLAQHLVSVYYQYNLTIDLITPIPLAKERKKQRGYNQAALLAQPLAHELKLPYNPLILRRIRETKSQVDLSFIERQINVKDAFQASHQAVQGKQILIIDDVITSGSTMNACADALMKVGSKSVIGLALARPVFHS